MSAEAELKQRIEQLLGVDRAKLETRWSDVRREMSRLEAGLERFDGRAQRWMDELIVPRFKVLAEMFPNSAALVRPGHVHWAVLPFRASDEFPVDARVEARVSFDLETERVRLTFAVSIIPILMDYERERTLEYGLETANDLEVGGFLDERIVRFVQDYLRVREPDSPYQKDRLVTDPVCGMRLRRTDVAASLEHGGRVFHFCVPACRDRFARDPDRYASGAGRHN